MEKRGRARLDRFYKKTGTVMMLHKLEKKDYIIPSSVELTLNGERLLPTSFDHNGNPAFDNVALLVLILKIRQMVKTGIIKDECDALVDYSYVTTDGKSLEIPLENRVVQSNNCPICGEKFTIKELDDGNVVKLDGCNFLAHKDCSYEFNQLKLIDAITEMVYSVFDPYSTDKKRLAKETGKYYSMSYEFIPVEYGWPRFYPVDQWFMFHTPIGDIKICQLISNITAQFMDNFPQFDSAIFNVKGTPNCSIESAPGYTKITAHSIKEMHECLDFVRNTVLSNKAQK